MASIYLGRIGVVRDIRSSEQLEQSLASRASQGFEHDFRHVEIVGNIAKPAAERTTRPAFDWTSDKQIVRDFLDVDLHKPLD